MPRRGPEPVDFNMTTVKVETPPEQREAITEGMRILVTWLLRRHQKTVRAPKDRSE